MEERLPHGWAWTTLEDVTSPNRVPVQPSAQQPLPFIGMEYVEAETMRLLGTGRSSGLRSIALHFWPGDVLYGRLRPYLNKVLHADFEGLCSAEFIIFRDAPHLDSRYLQYFLNAWRFRDFAAHLNEGDRPRVDWDQIKSHPFPLAPIVEQRRIVAAIEQQFTRLDAGVAALKRARARLKRYRASVLKAAVEGELTAEWRAAHPATETGTELLRRILAERRARWEADQRAKAKNQTKTRYWEPAGPDVAKLPELPEGWCWATVKQIAEEIVDCPHSTAKFGTGNMACLDTNSMAPGRILLHKLRYVDKTTFDERNRRLVPRAGDLVFAREGTVGTAVSLPEVPAVCLGQRVMLIRPTRMYVSKYLECCMMSSIIRAQYLPLLLGSTVRHINVDDVVRLAISVPPLHEQTEIVSEVERCLSVVTALEATVEANLKRAERLRQSILHEAFSGRLVAQDSNDEPASILLERIQAARTEPRPARDRRNGSRQPELWDAHAAGS
ncbi:MAG TPA: restriction endonuclease subunit S [Chloroflexota bacterium]|jgi:type I restriction enzyme S subunit